MSDLKQTAPYPVELVDLVSTVQLWPGWSISIEEDLIRDPADTHGAEGRGFTLVITTLGYNTYHYEWGENYSFRHLFIVPAATYNRRTWQRWLFDQFCKVQVHEAMEAFIVDGERPYAPHHGPGEDPYTVFEHGTQREVQTSFRGLLKGK